MVTTAEVVKVMKALESKKRKHHIKHRIKHHKHRREATAGVTAKATPTTASVKDTMANIDSEVSRIIGSVD